MIISADLTKFPKLSPDLGGRINVIAHSCNLQKTMGSGLAKQIVELYPQVFKADQNKNNQLDWLGKYLVVPVDKNKYVVNLYTQDKYGTDRRQVNYEAFYTALDSLVKSLSSKSPDYVLGLPYKISCGLAGGDWSIINTMIESISEKHKYDIWICKHD